MLASMLRVNAYPLLVCIFVILVSQAQADTPLKRAPVVASIKCEPKDQQTVTGEPIQIALTLQKTTDGELSLQTKWGFEWCRFELRDGSKVVAKWEPKRFRLPGTGFIPREEVFHDLSTPNTFHIVIPKMTSEVKPGNYTLTTHISFQYGVSREGNYLLKTAPSAELTVETPIVIVASDGVSTRDKVHRLFNKISVSKDAQARNALMQSLATFPADSAQGAWRTLLLNKGMPAQDRYQLAEALGSVASKPIVDTLLYVQFRDPLLDDEGNMVSVLPIVDGMRLICDDKLLRYIETEKRKHRGSPYWTSTPLD